jgi:hypothetical protein
MGTISGSLTTATVTWSDTLGMASIIVKADNSCGESDFSGAWNVLVETTKGIAEWQNQDVSICISPNPNNGEFILDLSCRKLITINLRIMDVLGNIVYNQNDIQLMQSLDMKISLHNLKMGVYFIFIDNGITAQATKFVIQK